MDRRNTALTGLFIATVALAGCGGGSDSVASGKSYCDVVKSADKNANLNTVLDSDQPPTKADLDVISKVFSEMAATAPAEIKTELADMRDFMKNDLSTMVGLNTQTTDPAELAKMLEKIGPITAKLEGLSAKMEKVALVTKEKCGIDLNA